MKVGCLVIATDLQKKSGVLKDCLASIVEADKKAGLFHRRLISVDLFKEKNSIDFSEYRNLGWEVIEHPRKGEVLNQKAGLDALSDCDYIYFSNDDNFVMEIPTKADMERIDAHLVGGKKLGYLDLTFKGYTTDQGALKNFILDESNHVDADGDNVFIIKDKSVINSSPHFIHFPIMIMPRSVMYSIIEYGLENFTNEPIESGYGRAYERLGYMDEYYQASFSKNPLLVKELKAKNPNVYRLMGRIHGHYYLLGNWRNHHVKGGHHFN